MLQLTVFLSGAALMAVEMLGSRILAPTFGSSIFVWGSLIGVVLTALSAGYYIGGHLADRFPSPTPLAVGVGVSGLWVWFLPAIAADLLPWLSRLDLGPRMGPLVASLLLFTGPSILMALVSPWAVRLAARSVSSMGSTAGGLSALSTFGSIAGTLITSFLLIPAMGVASLTRQIGLLLVALCALNLLVARRRAAALVAGLLAASMFAAGLILPGQARLTEATIPPEPPAAPVQTAQSGTAAAVPGQTSGSGAAAAPGQTAQSGTAAAPGQTAQSGTAAAPGQTAQPGAAEPPTVGPIEGSRENGVIFEMDSQYHHIRVQNLNGTRLLRFDESYQSGIYLSDPLRTRFEYTDVMTLPFALRPDAQRALLVGLGGGSSVKQLLTRLPSLRLDVAELDPAVITVARKYFGVPEHPRLTIAAQDGRQFIAQSAEKYDVILLDAYYASSIPFHLTTREFMQVAKSKMNAGGILAANIIGAISGPRSALLRSVAATMSAVFPQVYVVPVVSSSSDEYQNLILIATLESRRKEPADLVRAAEGAAETLGVPLLPTYAGRVVTRPLRSDDVPILTDDYAPVDNLMHIYE